MKTGAVTAVPGLPGRWSVWSKADEGPGAHFFVPVDDAARATGVKYAVVRVQKRAGEVKDVLTLLRTDPPAEVLARRQATS